MVISHKKRFVFVHIYRTGGTSITRELVRYARLKEQIATRYRMTRSVVDLINRTMGLFDDGNRWLLGAHKHATALELQAMLGPDRFRSYFSFAFVRNPWDWQCSLYHYIKRSRYHRDHRRANCMTFKQFLEYQIESNAPCQLDFLTDHEGNVMVDRIGRFERLQQDFNEIGATLDLPCVALEHLNSALRHMSPVNCYDPDSVSLVRDYFQRDIEQFRYVYQEANRAPC